MQVKENIFPAIKT